MGTEQDVKTILDWWNNEVIDDKHLFTLAPNGSLSINPTTFFPSREIANLTLQNATVVVTSLIKKYKEASAKIKEL